MDPGQRKTLGRSLDRQTLDYGEETAFHRHNPHAGESCVTHQLDVLGLSALLPAQMDHQVQIDEPVRIAHDLSRDHDLLDDEETAIWVHCLATSLKNFDRLRVVPIMQDRFDNIGVMAARHLDKKIATYDTASI
jgi:hypothetical protein